MVAMAKLGLLQGTLDMMVMRTLKAGPANGYEIAKAIERMSEDVLEVDHGSLYPALHRLGEKRNRQRQVGNLVDEPPRALLPSDRDGKETVSSRAIGLGADGGGDYARDAPGLRLIKAKRQRFLRNEMGPRMHTDKIMHSCDSNPISCCVWPPPVASVEPEA